MRWVPRTIRVRLTLGYVLLGVCPLLLVGVIMNWIILNDERGQAMVLQDQVAKRVSAEISLFIAKLQDELNVAVRTNNVLRRPLEEQESFLGSLQVHQKAFVSMSLLDAGGKEYVYVSRLRELGFVVRDKSQRPEFLVPWQSRQVYYGDIYLGSANREPLMILGVPIDDLRTGQIAGVLVAEVSLKQMWNLVGQLPTRPGESVYVVDKRNRVVAHQDPSVVLRGTQFSPPRDAGFQVGLSGQVVALVVERIQFGDQQFAVVAEQDASNALAAAMRLRWTVGTIVVVAFLAASAGGTLMVRKIIYPIQVLAEAARQIRSGSLDVTAKVVCRDEVGELAEAFNAMTARLSEMLRSLQTEAAERTRAQAELVAAGERLRETQVELVQSEKMSMLGQVAAGVAHEINTPTGSILNMMADAREHLRSLWESSESACLAPEDARAWLGRACRRVLTATREQSDASRRDARRQLEQELSRRGHGNARRLAAVILECCGEDWRQDDRLLEHLSTGPVLEALEHLIALRNSADISLASAGKIARIVRALRYYSHGGQDELTDLNVNESLDNALVILQNRIKHLAEIVVAFDASLPAARCAPDVSQVWTNVLNNACDAIEETQRQAPGRIEIATRLEADRVLVRISNDGPPIPKDAMHRIFDPFFTTKPRGKGTGLGLGICRGILNRCGGSIMARNEEEQVTFEVRLPVAAARRAAREAVLTAVGANAGGGKGE